MTLLVSACGLLIGAAIGGLVAWARLSGKLLAGGVGQAYAALFRGLPELLIVYFVYFGTSTLLTETANALGHEGFVGVPSFAAGALAVGVISGAYQAEVFRAAYLAISRGELEAAVSVGMNRALLFRRIICAQVLRFALPGLGNLWQVALKDSSLISVTGLTELMRISQVGAGSTHRPFAFYLGGAALYLVMTIATTRFLRRRRGARHPRHAPGDGLRRRMDFDFISKTFVRLLAALPLTLSVWFLSVVLGALIAAGVTWMRVSGVKPFELFARAYVMVFRGTPLLIQLFVVYYGLASLPAVRASFIWPFLRDALHLRRPVARALHRRLSGGDLSRRASCRAAWTGRGGARLRHVQAPHVPPDHLSDRAEARASGLFDRDDFDGEVDGARLAHHSMGRDEHRAEDPQRHAGHLSAAHPCGRDLFRRQLHHRRRLPRA